MSAALGSIGIPHNDAWAYSKVTQDFAQTGTWVFTGWNRPALVGQAILASPLESWLGLAGQHVFVAITALVLLAVTFVWVRRTTDLRWASLSVLVTLAFPGFLLLSTSFMTDVPASAAMIGCLALGSYALADRSWRRALVLLAGATTVGLLGVTIRDQAVVAPISVLFVAMLAWWQRDRRVAQGALALAVALAFLVLLFEIWRRGLPGADNPDLAFASFGGWMRAAVSATVTLGLVVLPLAVLPGWGALRSFMGRRGALLLIAIAFLGAVAMNRATSHPRLLGNYISPFGSYSGAASGRRPFLLPVGDDLVQLGAPGFLVVGMTAAGLVGAVLMTAAVIDLTIRRRTGHVSVQVWLPLTFTVLYLAGHVVQTGTGQGLFDRYLLPLVAPIAVLVGRSRIPPSPGASGGDERVGWLVTWLILVAQGVFSLSLALNAWAFDAARWSTGEQLVSQGWSPQQVDAGLEWVGWHATEAIARGQENPEDRTWWAGFFPTSVSCVLVSASLPADADTFSTSTYPRFGFFGPTDPLYVTRVEGQLCGL